MNNELYLIKQTITENFPEGEVILFGSHARNEATLNSDFDILVLSKKKYSSSEKMETRSRLRKLLVQKKIPVEILLMSTEEMEMKKHFTGHIAKTISEEGVRL